MIKRDSTAKKATSNYWEIHENHDFFFSKTILNLAISFSFDDFRAMYDVKFRCNGK